MEKRRQRTAERIARELLRLDHDLDAVHRLLLEQLADELDLASACWHACDPATGFPIGAGAAGDPPGSFEEGLRYEFVAGERGSFNQLWRDRPTVHAMGLATGGRPTESPRFREMIAPSRGIADELRIALADGFGNWSAAVFFARRPLGEEDVALVETILPAAALSVRRAAMPLLADDSPPAPPAVVIIDAADRLRAADRQARDYLGRLGTTGAEEPPGVLSFLAAKARLDDPLDPPVARTRTEDGVWLALDASLLGDGPGSDVAIVLRPAPGPGVLDAVLRGFGLSEREREVAALAAQGKTDRAIAAALYLSPWTVSDHLKAAYEKTGVGGRAELGTLTMGKVASAAGGSSRAS
jgi:DNA-binding CsgD family transcriptional regulator